jgi:hypothetical protein
VQISRAASQITISAALVATINLSNVSAATTLVSQYQFTNAGNLSLDSTANHNQGNVMSNVFRVAGPRLGICDKL